MKVVVGKPPVFDEIVARIGKPPAGAVFTYGDTVYAAVGELDAHLLEHEAVHSQQQAESGPNVWWDRYLADPQFRLAQELQAYQHQYRWICARLPNRKLRREALRSLAKDLSSRMYGSLVTKAAAAEAIR